MSSKAESPILASVVIPSFRSCATIGHTLDSLLSQAGVDWRRNEILVVDSSDDDTASRIREGHPSVRLIQHAGRLLPGAARNLGARAARGRFLAFLDADAQAAADWLATLLKRIGSDESIRVVGAVVANANPASRASRILHWIEFSEQLPNQKGGFRRTIASCNLLLRRQAFDSTGGFDPERAMAEDLLFCHKLGSGIYLESGTSVLHRHREEWREVHPHLRKLGYWSGRLRADHPLSGSFIRRLPILSYALVPLRFTRISRRALAAAGLPAVLSASTGILAGLWSWSQGFRKGIRGDLEPD